MQLGRLALIARAGVAPGALTLEIAESGVMTDPEAAIAMLWGLRRIGVRLSVDDFGTGHSLLASLGCDLAQGFHLVCPLPPDDLARLAAGHGFAARQAVYPHGDARAAPG